MRSELAGYHFIVAEEFLRVSHGRRGYSAAMMSAYGI
jgi:hypothetical protein